MKLSEIKPIFQIEISENTSSGFISIIKETH